MSEAELERKALWLLLHCHGRGQLEFSDAELEAASGVIDIAKTETGVRFVALSKVPMEVLP